MLFFSVIIFVVSMALLIKSSDLFTEKAELVGKKFGIPSFIIGVTIVAMGTSLPELSSAIVSVLHGASEIVAGNVVGSNIANILLILGVSTLFVKGDHKIKWNLLHGDFMFIVSSTIFLAIVLRDGNLSIIESLLLFGSYIIYFFYNYDIHKDNMNTKVDNSVNLAFFDIILLLLSVGFVAFSADKLIDSVLDIANELNIGTEILGLTAVAIGTSLPELAVSVSAVRKGNVEMALGNVSGSNIFNSFVVMSIPRFVGNIIVPATLFTQSVPFLGLATALFLMMIIDHKIHRFEGALMVMLYLFFIIETFI